MMNPLVLKLGGSLLDAAERIIPVLIRSGRNLLIVPGGGSAADSVRGLHADDEISHWLAVLSMEYNGLILASKGIEYTDDVMSEVDGVKVLLPYLELRSLDPLPHSWDVTSDTIAAWVALRRSSDLLIMKSIDGIYSDGKFVRIVDKPLQTDSVDPSLIPFVLKHRIRTFVINGRNTKSLTEFLNEEKVKGSLIRTPK